MSQNIEMIENEVRAKAPLLAKIVEEVGRVIVGQRMMVERLLIGLLADGHVLVEGVPGLAKTTAVKTLAQAMSSEFKRIQFTPDLLPADVVGTQVYNPHDHSFSVKKGPVFANLVLADEINRAPAKVQSALLEAMQERQVTIGDATLKLPKPFLVMATQNPIEHEGTYPLPEAEVDRFIMKIRVDYPSRDEEIQIVRRMESGGEIAVAPVFSPEEVISMREVVASIHVEEKLYGYVADVVFASRDPEKFGLAELKPLIQYGASPRASIYLIQAAKAFAFMHGRGFVTPQDIKSIGLDVLRHRVIISYEAEARDMKPEEIVQRIFDKIDVP
ncbi:MAG: MoxR family ATPase [Pseudomonadota bacterium]